MKDPCLNLGSKLVFAALCFVGAAAGELAIAQLTPPIQADRHMFQAERELDDGDAAAAVETLEQVLELQAEHGLELPDVFWFTRAEAAQRAGRPELALESLVRYFERSGQDGEQFLAALELYHAAELAKAEADAEAEAARLEAQAEALAAAGEAMGPEMVVIPAGSFRMGCVSGQDCINNELPVHEVTIPEAFAVSRYEVTFAEWDACVLDGGCGGYSPDDRGLGRGTRPVIEVSWEDAQAYVSWLSSRTGKQYRLLSEAEWEYVARAGAETAYSWGDAIGTNRANCNGCGSQWEWRTAPVGLFAANAFGVHDMHGNVWEWVEDCWNSSYAGAPSDGSAWRSGDCEGRVLRGGSLESSPKYLRSAVRNRNTTANRNIVSVIGFRVARTLIP